MTSGTTFVLTAPFTEMIDHAGYFIQMGDGVDADLDGAGD